MREIEEKLRESKTKIDNIRVPEELEERLNKALAARTVPKLKKRNWNRVVAACIMALFIGTNFNSLAYYGKKILGYDQVMNGTLKQLNELEKGQLIGKSYTFKNGMTITLDGIMVDENQLLTFYTLSDPTGNIENTSLNMSISGLIKEYRPKTGQGKINNEKTEIKWIQSFEKPYIFERKLQLEFMLIVDNNMSETGNISFKIDPNKAMEYTLKQDINNTIETDGIKIHLESIVASPTKTVIYGSIRNIIELAYDQLLGERLSFSNLDIDLIANGQKLQTQSGGMSTGMKGIKFHKDYDALPEPLESLQLRINSFSVERDANKKVEMNTDLKDSKIEVLGQNIEINNIYESGESTYITITTKEDIVLTKVGLIVDEERINLKETINSEFKKLNDGTIMHTRTLRFPKSGDRYQFSIEKMVYTKLYNKTIEVPLNE